VEVKQLLTLLWGIWALPFFCSITLSIHVCCLIPARWSYINIAQIRQKKGCMGKGQRVCQAKSPQETSPRNFCLFSLAKTMPPDHVWVRNKELQMRLGQPVTTILHKHYRKGGRAYLPSPQIWLLKEIWFLVFPHCFLRSLQMVSNVCVWGFGCSVLLLCEVTMWSPLNSTKILFLMSESYNTWFSSFPLSHWEKWKWHQFKSMSASNIIWLSVKGE
jgi:hypothetical protein